MKCTICGNAIILIPSARARAEKLGGKPSDYTRLFMEHASCAIAKRDNDTLNLIRQLNEVKQ